MRRIKSHISSLPAILLRSPQARSGLRSQIARYSVHGQPLSGSNLDSQRKRLTIADLIDKYEKQEPISMLTAIDFHSSSIVDQADVDMILVGDSLGMTALGYESTVPVTMDDMIHHSKAVLRGSSRSFLVGDLPFGSYEFKEDAVHNAVRFLKEAGLQAVKLEGGDKVDQVRAINNAGVPVIGHIGLTPQSINQIGSYKVVGKTPKEAVNLWESAQAIQEAGAKMIVLECVPQRIAQVITQSLSIPTIGIGSGVHCSGQVLVYHDMMGMFQRFSPKFCKSYLSLNEVMREACNKYSREVKNKQFPETGKHTYVVNETTFKAFLTSTGLDKEELPSAVPDVNISQDPIQSIVVLGSGAVGQLVTTGLLQSASGKNITLVPGRVGETEYNFSIKEGLKKEGIELILPDGSHSKHTGFHLATTLNDIPSQVDLLIVTVKNFSTSAVLSKLLEERKDVTIKRIITLQNGADNTETIKQILTKNGKADVPVHQGSLYTGVHKVDQYKIQSTSDLIDLKLPASLQKSLVHTSVFGSNPFSVSFNPSDNIDWRKLIVNSVINPLTAIFRVQNHEIAANIHLRSMASQILSECLAVIRSTPSASEQFSPNELSIEAMTEHIFEVAKSTGSNTSSMLKDVLHCQRKNSTSSADTATERTEIDSLNGFFVKRAAQVGIAVPVNEMMVQMVKYSSSL